MEPSQELIDRLYLDKVASARAMSEEQRFAAGLELFDFACEVTKAGIRSMHPDANEARVLELLRKRLAWAERWERSS